MCDTNIPIQLKDSFLVSEELKADTFIQHKFHKSLKCAAKLQHAETSTAWSIDPSLYLPSKLLHTMQGGHKEEHTHTLTHRLQYGGTHFQLKGSICIPGKRRLSRFMILPPRDGGASSPCVGSNSTVIHFPRYLFMVTQSNKCAVCSVMLHHTSDKVTWVSTSLTAKVTLTSFAFHLLLPREAEHFFSFVSWKYSLTK